MSVAIDPDTVATNLAAVRARIERAGGDPAAVRIVAVTKGFGPDAVHAALDAGMTDIGESYAQELEQKAAALANADEPPRWHFVGRLQRNKVRRIATLVSLWQSVDRDELAATIAAASPGAAVLVQVNATGEQQKGGCPPTDVPALIEASRTLGLDVRGLMTVGPIGSPEAARPAFRAVRDLVDRLGLAECSMGMTGDLEVAVQEGSTMVRVGTALFGPRATARA